MHSKLGGFVPQCAAIKERNAALMQSLQLQEAAENVHKVMKVAKEHASHAKKQAKQAARPPPVRKVYSLRSNTILPTADARNCKDESDDAVSMANEAEVDWNAVEDSNIHKYLSQNSADQVRCEQYEPSALLESLLSVHCVPNHAFGIFTSRM